MTRPEIKNNQRILREIFRQGSENYPVIAEYQNIVKGMGRGIKELNPTPRKSLYVVTKSDVVNIYLTKLPNFNLWV